MSAVPRKTSHWGVGAGPRRAAARAVGEDELAARRDSDPCGRCCVGRLPVADRIAADEPGAARCDGVGAATVRESTAPVWPDPGLDPAGGRARAPGSATARSRASTRRPRAEAEFSRRRASSCARPRTPALDPTVRPIVVGRTAGADIGPDAAPSASSCAVDVVAGSGAAAGVGGPCALEELVVGWAAAGAVAGSCAGAAAAAGGGLVAARGGRRVSGST